MVLDPQVKALLEQMEASDVPPMESLSPEQARAGFQSLNDSSTEELEPVGYLSNRVIPGPGGDLPIRIYTPEGTGPFPVLVFYHGGGWVIGDLDSHDNMCRSLTNLANTVVVSVDYRLAPEHKFPAAVDDCYTALRWVSEHPSELNIDSSHIAVGGDSAGGNLSTVVSYLTKQRGGPQLAYQLLLYPSTHISADTASHRENGEGYFLTTESMTYFRNHYLRTVEDAEDPLVSPYLIEDLSGLPPAMVVTAEYDPLRDEGEAYARRLKEAGVPVIAKRYDGMIHGFISMAEQLDKGKQALQDAAQALRSAFDE
ncbi:alpha/beta hydrolase [Tuberibacillus sp. Marseille-P3662]|uniref:alpha/beta hydrolase n=1 Tax=Tuberibacillus sp. Marseille-P3662 TaxID=1965358 RepID=UPI000A1CACAC|nr:alpha/beta hydrolase [Tuberibacillus sp. Marseille-P3662]